MMIELFIIATQHCIPNVDLALDEPNGLLAFGGDLSCKRLRNAYRLGFFLGTVKASLFCGGLQILEQLLLMIGSTLVSHCANGLANTPIE